MLAGATLRPQLSEKFHYAIHSAANERAERERERESQTLPQHANVDHPKLQGGARKTVEPCLQAIA